MERKTRAFVLMLVFSLLPLPFFSQYDLKSPDVPPSQGVSLHVGLLRTVLLSS